MPPSRRVMMGHEDVFSASINDVTRMTGLSRSEIYRRMADGDIRAVKAGSRTLILMDSVRRYMAGLPVVIYPAKLPDDDDAA